MTRPLGVRGVTNPLPATGAADAEKLDDARRNAPLTVLTLGRIVSLQDYEDFARAFSGIDKALATWTLSGESSGVYLTVAGSQGAAVDESSQLYSHLVKAINLAGDPAVRFWVKSYRPRLFRVAAGLKLDPDLLPDAVVQSVTARLRDDFSFQARSFGQPVHLSEVVEVIQNVQGVIAVEMRGLYLSDQAPVLNQDLTAAIPTPGAGILPAELLMLDARPLSLEVLP
jgi:predicted phage baseplate assembly protein